MKVEQVLHKSKEYWDLVQLRSKILRIPLGLAFSEEELEKEMNQLHFGAFENKEAIGVMVLVKQENHKIKVRQVAVSESHQSKNLGTFLLKFCEEYALKNNFQLMHCNARENALNFYLKNGYQIKGKSFKEVGIVHYYMEKEIRVKL